MTRRLFVVVVVVFVGWCVMNEWNIYNIMFVCTGRLM